MVVQSVDFIYNNGLCVVVLLKMKWPIESIYEVTKKKLENCHLTIFFIRITVSLIFVEFLGCQKYGKKNLCYPTLLQTGNWMADAKHLLRYSLKYRRKKNSA